MSGFCLLVHIFDCDFTDIHVCDFIDIHVCLWRLQAPWVKFSQAWKMVYLLRTLKNAQFPYFLVPQSLAVLFYAFLHSLAISIFQYSCTTRVRLSRISLFSYHAMCVCPCVCEVWKDCISLISSIEKIVSLGIWNFKDYASVHDKEKMESSFSITVCLFFFAVAWKFMLWTVDKSFNFFGDILNLG